MITYTKANDWRKSTCKQLRKLATQQINEQTQNTKQFTFYNFNVGVIYSVFYLIKVTKTAIYFFRRNIFYIYLIRFLTCDW